jgi:hypothetical protein
MRRLLIASVVLAILAGTCALGWVGYDQLTHGTPPPVDPEFKDNISQPLVQEDKFEKLAKEDPVALLAQCLSRYQREVKGGMHFTLEKQERPKGMPKPPTLPPVEIVDVWARGDVPDPEMNKTAIEVQMKWKSGARKPSIGIGPEIRATFFSEKPKSEGGLDGKVVAWPGIFGNAVGNPLPPNIELAKGQSRYCIRDAGVYRSMLRTHEAWKLRQEAGELKTEYLGKKTPEKIGRECYVIKRICPRTEIDSFEVGGTASAEPDVVAREGFTEVTIYIDVERWLQVGSELFRTEPDGTRVLVGTYYQRDVQLNPSIPPDTFTTEGLKK